MTFCPTHRSVVPHPIIIREASCSIWKLTQRPITGQHATLDLSLVSYLHSLGTELPFLSFGTHHHQRPWETLAIFWCQGQRKSLGVVQSDGLRWCCLAAAFLTGSKRHARLLRFSIWINYFNQPTFKGLELQPTWKIRDPSDLSLTLYSEWDKMGAKNILCLGTKEKVRHHTDYKGWWYPQLWFVW